MERKTLLCRQCRNVFRSRVESSVSIGLEPRCPRCGSAGIEEAPPWAPLGSGFNIFDDSTWEYECQQCKNKFKMPIPKSPSEEKARTCLLCHSSHLHLLTIKGGEPLYCG